MPTQQEKAEHAMSVLMRLGISIVMPLWGVIMLILGFSRGSILWIATGAVVAGVGAMLFVASPIADRVLDIRESWRIEPTKKP